ncbi:unnamed protein product, partial [Auanema sp. JU1783]
MSPKSKPAKHSQLRRNERERKRVHQVNDGFDLLRCRVPKSVANKKLSKADTLREAVKYINYLQSILNSDYSSSSEERNSCTPNSFPACPKMEPISPNFGYSDVMDSLSYSQPTSSNEVSPAFSYPLNTSSSSSSSPVGNYSPMTSSMVTIPTTSSTTPSALTLVPLAFAPQSYTPRHYLYQNNILNY